MTDVQWRMFTMIVVSGQGTAGTKGLESETRRAEIEAVSGVAKVPGSLNLRSSERVWLRRREGTPWSGGLMYRGQIDGIDVAFNKFGGFAAGPHLIHVYADCHLKTELSLADGDETTFAIPDRAVVRFPIANEAVYALRLFRRKVIGRD